MRELLRERDSTLEDLQAALSDAIPNLISVTFNPQAHHMQKEATIADIARRILPNPAAPNAPPPVGKQWDSRRGSNTSLPGLPSPPNRLTTIPELYSAPAGAATQSRPETGMRLARVPTWPLYWLLL